MVKSLVVSVLLVICCVVPLEGGNILGLLPMPFYSHTNTFMPIFNELAARGHNVTIYSPFPLKEPVKNLKHITVENLMPNGPPEVTTDQLLKMRTFSWFQTLTFWYFGLRMTSEMINLKPLQELAHDQSSKFDLVITETFFMQEPLVAYGYKFSAPVVNLNPAAPSAWVSYITGTPNFYSYVSDLRQASTDRMSFWERFCSTLFGMTEIFVARFYAIPRQESLMKELFPEPFPPLIDMLMNTSITLVDSHFSFGYPRPYHNNIVEIGGLSIQTDLPLISKEVLDFMEGAEEGVVYFSMGSWLKPSELSASILETLIKGLGGLKQRVLWKWDGEPLQNKPKNILLAPWFPQNSILAHPKVRCFVSHGGIHSLYESLYWGIPLVGVPLMADQPHNLKFIEEEGLGVPLEITELTAESLREAINKVIGDPKFKERVALRSLILKDRPQLALKNAIYWIEHVMEHRGARHLRPASLDISYTRYLLLDVFAAFLAIATLLVASVFLCLRFTCRLCFRRSRHPSDKKKKQ